MLWHPKRNRSYASSADLPTDSIRKNFSMVGGYTENLENNKTVKIRGWALDRVWALARDNMVMMLHANHGCVTRTLMYFVEASPTVEKAESCYKADRLVASLPSFRCERGHGQVCANL